MVEEIPIPEKTVFIMKQGPVGYRIICVRLFKLHQITVSYL